MIVAGGAGFLASVLLLWSPAQMFELMAPRYGVAAFCGYLAFIVLIRVWIALQRSGDGFDLELVDLDPLDLLDAVGPDPLRSATRHVQRRQERQRWKFGALVGPRALGRSVRWRVELRT